jgi:HD superfamily phosphodiesterase
MCDKKYMNEKEGIEIIEEFLKEKIPREEIDITKKIISTMSYSTVKKNGFPDLQEYQLAYHIVREADLLCGYDFDRALIYNMYMSNGNINTAFADSEKIFNNRVFKHFDDNLFVTDYSKDTALVLQTQSLIRMNAWRGLVKNPIF